MAELDDDFEDIDPVSPGALSELRGARGETVGDGATTGKAALRGALADAQRQAGALGKTYEQLTRERQAKVQQQRQIIDGTIQRMMAARQSESYLPLLAAASGLLSPTRSGSTGEGIGNALRALTPVLAARDRSRQDFELQTGQLESQGAGLETGLVREQQQDTLKRMLSGERMSGALATALARAEKSQEYAPTLGEKLAQWRDRLMAVNPNHPDLPLVNDAIKNFRTQGEPTNAQLLRIETGQTARDEADYRRVRGTIFRQLRAMDQKGDFASPQARALEEARMWEENGYDPPPAVLQRAGIQPQSGHPAQAPPAGAVPISESAPPPVAGATPAAPMPGVTITTEPREAPPPIASPSPSEQRKGPGYTLRLPSGEEDRQRDIITHSGIALNLIDEITGRLNKESGLSSTTGIGGNLQRAYNATLGQAFGNLNAEDTETMAKMAALKPVLQRASKVDSQMGPAERKDLERVLETWGTLTSRDTILTNFKVVADILKKRNEAARARLGPRANEPVSRETQPKRLRYNPATGKLE